LAGIEIDFGVRQQPFADVSVNELNLGFGVTMPDITRHFMNDTLLTLADLEVVLEAKYILTEIGYGSFGIHPSFSDALNAADLYEVFFRMFSDKFRCPLDNQFREERLQIFEEELRLSEEVTEYFEVLNARNTNLTINWTMAALSSRMDTFGLRSGDSVSYFFDSRFLPVQIGHRDRDGGFVNYSVFGWGPQQRTFTVTRSGTTFLFIGNLSGSSGRIEGNYNVRW
jgi:hypothetical protein